MNIASPPSHPIPVPAPATPGTIGTGLILCFISTAFAAGLGALASADAAQFYSTLSQPSWAPPSWVFGPVWSALYLMMGIAAWLVWRTPAPGPRRMAMGFYLSQLVLNGLWSWLFFYWKEGGLAFADILLLIGLVLATFFSFLRLHRVAGILLLPYLAWILFAAALNFTVWKMNPTIL